MTRPATLATLALLLLLPGFSASAQDTPLRYRIPVTPHEPSRGPEDALVTRLDVRSSELYHQSRYLFGQGNLVGDFDLSKGKLTAVETKAGSASVVLKPKKASRDFKQLVLVIDAKTGEIRRTELTDPYDNVSIVTFDKVEYRTLDAKSFSFTPPANATIRDLSKSQGKPPSKDK